MSERKKMKEGNELGRKWEKWVRKGEKKSGGGEEKRKKKGGIRGWWGKKKKKKEGGWYTTGRKVGILGVVKKINKWK